MKHPQGKVDAFRGTLSPESDAEFLRLAGIPNVNITALHRWLLERGYEGSYQSVSTWTTAFAKKGEQAIRFNKLTEAYIGVVPEQALQKIVVVFGNLLDEYLEQISISEGEIHSREYLRVVPHLAREVRSCAEAIHQLKYLGDRREIEAAGYHRVCAELRLIFEDSPFSSALEAGINCALAKLEAQDG